MRYFALESCSRKELKAFRRMLSVGILFRRGRSVLLFRGFNPGILRVPLRLVSRSDKVTRIADVREQTSGTQLPDALFFMPQF